MSKPTKIYVVAILTEDETTGEVFTRRPDAVAFAKEMMLALRHGGDAKTAVELFSSFLDQEVTSS